MSYLDFNDKIGVKEPLTYNDFNESISYHTVNLLRSTNNYAKKTAINLLESSHNTNDAIEYEKTLKDTSTSITDLYERLVDSEYNRLYEKTVNMKNIVDNIKKKILMGKLPECNEYPLYEKFFKPDLDRLSDALSKPFINLVDEMLGQKIIFSSDELNGSQQKIIDLIQTVQTQVGKDRNTMKSLLPKVSDNENFDSIIDIKNTIKSNIDGYKKINMVYDNYLYEIQFILNQFANHSIDCDECSDHKVVTSDGIEKDIEMEKTYDVSGVNECILNMDEKIEYINAQLENISIKLELASLNESSDGAPSKFMQFIEWLINALKALKDWLIKTFRELVIKAKQHIDFYGKWVSANNDKIRNAINNINNSNIKLNVCDWSLNKPIDVSNVINKMNTILSSREPDESVEKLEGALKTFEKFKTKEDIYNVLGQSLSGKLKFNKNKTKKDKFADIIGLYRSDPKEKTITKGDIALYINILINSSKKLKQLLDSSQINALVETSDELTKNLDKVKTNMNNGTYSAEECVIVKKYWSAKKTVLDVAKQLCFDVFEINYRLLNDRAYEAYRVLKAIIKNNNSMNDSVEFSSDQYIEMVNLLECGEIQPGVNNILDGGMIDKNANIQDFVSEPISSNVSSKINEMKLYPIQKLTNGVILMKSDIDNSVWNYNTVDKSLVCQNTLNSVYSN